MVSPPENRTFRPGFARHAGHDAARKSCDSLVSTASFHRAGDDETLMKRALFVLAVSLFQLPLVAHAADIVVMSGGAPKDVLVTLVPQFEKLTGHRVTPQHVLVSALRQRILAGEPADVLLMPNTVLDTLATMHKILPEDRAAFGSLKLVAIVKYVAPSTEIYTVDNFRRALVDAPSVVYST